MNLICIFTHQLIHTLVIIDHHVATIYCFPSYYFLTYLLIFKELLRHWQISHEEVTRGNAYESHSRFDEAYHRFFYRGCCHVSRNTMLDEIKAMCKYLFCLFLSLNIESWFMTCALLSGLTPSKVDKLKGLN